MGKVKIGIIGGSGLGDALGVFSEGKSVKVDTPFGECSDEIIETNWKGWDIALLNRHGPGHVLNPSMINYRANIYALKAIGCTHIIASGAVGSLREHIRPKDLVIPDQVIDKTYRRIGSFFDEYFAAHVEFAAPFCPVLRKHLLNCADVVNTSVHDGGTYVCMEGPAFSTRAESEMHRLWGGDLIGMTCMPEAKLAREAEIAYALVALVSDYDCWQPHPSELDKHALLKEIIENLTDATANAISLIKAAIERFGEIADIPSPAHSALSLAIWTDKTKISPEAKKKLGVLVEKYL
ncbi:MAG: S-methyl-5'-thioadenosine phosphorylase [Thermoproteota archaeon]|nr:MAG: S-methyl-5'-thioadenosine phosphorylase [Candidatus Korarchaeota archaeon]